MNKTVFSFLIAAMMTMIITGCSKSGNKESESYTCVTCTQTPEALAANDASSKGIYKGVVTGSTGSIRFDIANSANTIYATMVLDGVTTLLASTVSWTSGQPYTAAFTGTMSGSPVSITFSVGASGDNPVITASSIPGHTQVVFTLAKETSASLVEVFEGTYSTTKPETGTFNIILSRNAKVWGGVARKTGGTSVSQVGGSISSGGAFINSANNISMATLSGDNISGSFADSDGQTVTVSGKRTL